MTVRLVGGVGERIRLQQPERGTGTERHDGKAQPRQRRPRLASALEGHLLQALVVLGNDCLTQVGVVIAGELHGVDEAVLHAAGRAPFHRQGDSVLGQMEPAPASHAAHRERDHTAEEPGSDDGPAPGRQVNLRVEEEEQQQVRHRGGHGEPGQLQEQEPFPADEVLLDESVQLCGHCVGRLVG